MNHCFSYAIFPQDTINVDYSNYGSIFLPRRDRIAHIGPHAQIFDEMSPTFNYFALRCWVAQLLET